MADGDDTPDLPQDAPPIRKLWWRFWRGWRKGVVFAVTAVFVGVVGNPHVDHHFSAQWMSRNEWAVSGRWQPVLDPAIARYRGVVGDLTTRDFFLFSTTELELVASDAIGAGGPRKTKHTLGALFHVWHWKRDGD